MHTFKPSGRAGGTSLFIWISSILTSFLLLTFNAQGQETTCTASALSVPTVHAEGLAEQIGDIRIMCAGGTGGAALSLSVFVTLNTNLTNRLDSSGNLQGITVSLNTGGGAVPAGTLQPYSVSTIFISNLRYTVPVVPATPVTIIISGMRAAPAMLPGSTAPPLITGSIIGVGAQFTTTSIGLAVAAPTLLTSMINNGVPCTGSPLPPALDFLNFAATSVFSSIRITEASPNAFTPKIAGSDTGVRILVRLSGYGASSRIFVPDAIVGSSGALPTSTGLFNSTTNSGSYAPSSNQLLLIRVNAADSNGAGGTLAIPVPVPAMTFAAVTEIPLTNGTGYAVYEVVDSNANLSETAQIPVFLVAPQTACTGATIIPTLGVALAPVSKVTVGTATDPIPRFADSTPGSDCTQLGDCSASYFPALTVDATPLNLRAASLGSRQTATLAVGNAGGGVINLAITVTYPAGSSQLASSWLSVTPISAQAYSQNAVNLQIIADPVQLPPGTYTANININAGAYGMASVPVTFTVGPVGVTIQNIGNAASFQFGTVAPGSYTVLFGLNLAGNNVSVTFNQVPATIVYDSATQINLIVPTGLGNQLAADVLVTVDGKVSNSFKVNLALNAPGIFSGGVVNFDGGSVNNAANPVARGGILVVYLTGLSNPPSGQVTVNIGSQLNLIPLFAGAQPTLPALDQVNITVPAALAATPNPVPLQICIPGSVGQPVCSNQVNLYIK